MAFRCSEDEPELARFGVVERSGGGGSSLPEAEIDGIRVFFEDLGSGPCVVLLHSFLCSGEMWAGQTTCLAERCRVVNVDLRGHGRSGPAERPFTLDDLVSDVSTLLAHLEIPRAVWAGLSIGGMIALRAALRRSSQVAGLILLDTHAGAERTWKRLEYGAMALGTRIVGLRPFLPVVTRLMFGRTTRRLRPELVREWRGRFAQLHVPSMLRTLEALNRRDSVVAALPQIELPALVMVGEEDRSLPPSFSRQLAAGLRDSQLVTVPHAGHLSALEQSEPVNAAMLGFLQRINWGAPGSLPAAGGSQDDGEQKT